VKTIQGVVRGRSIDLKEETGLEDGASVDVVLTPRSSPPTRKWGDGILQSAGGWADVPGIDEVMEEIARSRKSERRPQ